MEIEIEKRTSANLENKLTLVVGKRHHFASSPLPSSLLRMPHSCSIQSPAVCPQRHHQEQRRRLLQKQEQFQWLLVRVHTENVGISIVGYREFNWRKLVLSSSSSSSLTPASPVNADLKRLLSNFSLIHYCTLSECVLSIILSLGLFPIPLYRWMRIRISFNSADEKDRQLRRKWRIESLSGS